MLTQKSNSLKGLATPAAQRGFTIIEVLIVLAIGGLILLIVFLAVPALQRNSRNTQRASDIAALGGALSEYVNNNNAVLPVDDASWEANVKPNYKFGYYDASLNTTVVYNKNNSAANRTAVTNPDVINVHTYTKCNGNNAVGAGASSRSVVALYAVEGGNGAIPQCKEL